MIVTNLDFDVRLHRQSVAGQDNNIPIVDPVNNGRAAQNL